MRRHLFAHLETWRPYTLFYVGLVSLAGAHLAADTPPTWRLVAAWLAPTLGWLAGLYGGDYFDRHLDALAKPYRPIPSGRMRPEVAFGGMVVNIVLGAAIGLVLNPLNVLVALVTLMLGLAYSRSLKARGALGNLVRGGPMALAFVFGTLATSRWPLAAILPLALVFWLHDAGSNLVGALRDIDGDRKGGYETFPVKHGVAHALRLVGGLYLAWLSLAVIYPGALGLPIDRAAYYMLLVPAAALGLGALILLLRAPSPLPRMTALRAHEVLVIERLVLAAAFVAAGSSAGVGIALLIPAVTATAFAQRTLRRRYEFDTQAATSPDAATIEAYVDEQLKQIAMAGKLQRHLAGWERCIRIHVRDLPFTIYLVIAGGRLLRVDQATHDASALESIAIETTSATFADIFLHHRTNPRRAYLLGQIHLQCSPRDMLSLNQLFNGFRAMHTSPRPSIVVSDTRPDTPVAEEQMRGQVVLSDTTLRDGEQMPGVAFSIEEKVALARQLDALGIPLIEAGFPAVSAEEAEAIRAIVALRLNAIVQVIARPVPGDIDAAVATGAQSVALFVGTSDTHIANKLRTTRPAIVRQVTEAVRYAKQAGVQVVFAAEDATRTPLSFLVEVYRAAVGAGADAIGIADTAGVMTPPRMARLVAQVGEATGVPIAVHCHDDLGLATANSIAGLLAGASGVQCSLLGIGERAGNAALEEVALALEVGYGYRTGLDLSRLLPLAASLSAILGLPLPPNKAVLGSNVFVHESGLHVDGIARDPSTYEPYPPELIGQRRRFVFGKHSGRSAVAHVLEQHQVPFDEQLCQRLLDEVKRAGQAKAPLDEAGMLHLARRI